MKLTAVVLLLFCVACHSTRRPTSLHGFEAEVMGVLFGLVREGTGSVWLGVAVHGLWDIWITALLVLSRVI